MDDLAAITHLDSVVGLLNESRLIYHERMADYWEHPRWPQLQEQINAALPGVRRIAAATDAISVSALDPVRSPYTWEWEEVRDAIWQLRGALEQHEVINSILEFSGPQISASQLHEWVWQPVGSLWDGGHYRSALQMAATSVSGQLQAKLGRYDLMDSDLVTQAFSDKSPSPTDPRLRFPGYAAGTPSYRSAHDGAMMFGRGCMLGIRNLATHGIAELDEQEPLEQLAALSVLARWIDTAAVVTQ